ncbi:MAG: polysaccharide biosynthesis protein PslH [Solirubrobacteraceae bacterium]|nr:polysaccharide biosynthesis protein PslH [Solirubrobacteraceae bacterium]
MQRPVHSPPSVLWLTHEPPLPAVTGSRVRSGRLVAGLGGRGHRVSLFSVATGAAVQAHDRRDLAELAERAVVAPLGIGAARRRARLVVDLLRGRAFQERWFDGPRAHAQLDAWLAAERFDVIVAGGLYMLAYVPPRLLARTVLDSHNVDAQRLASMAEALFPRPRGIAARLQLGPVRRFEQASAGRVRAVLACSEQDAAYFEPFAPGRVSVVPNGVDCASMAPRDDVAPGAEVLFVGTMTYSANVDAALELLRDVAPRLRRRDARITLVGDGAPRSVRAAAGACQLAVELPGRVPDTAPWFQRSRVFAAPLRFGGGTRLKILESLARGVPVVSTTTGADGLGLVHERDVILADDPADFAAWVDRLLSDDDLCRSLSLAGRRAAERHDWTHAIDPLEQALLRVCGP